MARTRSNQKAAIIDDDTPPASPSESTRQDVRRKKKTKRRKAVAAEESDIEEIHSATIFKTPENPQATFEGLPAELRHQVYEYIGDSLLFHLRKHVMTKKQALSKPESLSPFILTHCRHSNPKTPLLCANPEWSGMCKEQDRCSYEADAPGEPRGPWALASSSKAIHNETKGLFSPRGAVVSVNWTDLHHWLNYLLRCVAERIERLRHITLTGPIEWAFSYQNLIQLLKEWVSNLEALGFQLYARGHDVSFPGIPPASIDVVLSSFRTWLTYSFLTQFESPITFAVEVIIRHKPARYCAIRMLPRDHRHGESESEGAGHMSMLRLMILGSVWSGAALRNGNTFGWRKLSSKRGNCSLTSDLHTPYTIPVHVRRIRLLLIRQW